MRRPAAAADSLTPCKPDDLSSRRRFAWTAREHGTEPMRHFHLAIGLALQAGCFSAPRTRALPPGHPADPRGASSPFESVPNPFAGTPTFPPPAVPGTGVQMQRMPHGADMPGVHHDVPAAPKGGDVG